MISLNKVILLGCLGSDPQIMKSKDGKEFANLNLATNENYLSKDGGWKAKITEWHKVVVFKTQLINTIKMRLAKGDMVYVEGSISTSKWQDGQKKSKSEIQILVKDFHHVLKIESKTNKNTLGDSDLDLIEGEGL